MIFKICRIMGHKQISTRVRQAERFRGAFEINLGNNVDGMFESIMAETINMHTINKVCVF